jgi:hypothetical protein
MYEQHRARGPSDADTHSIGSICAGCGAHVLVGLRSRTTRGPNGSMGAITYADTDIAVWDCPACGHPNADAFRE